MFFDDSALFLMLASPIFKSDAFLESSIDCLSTDDSIRKQSALVDWAKWANWLLPPAFAVYCYVMDRLFLCCRLELAELAEPDSGAGLSLLCSMLAC